MALFGSKKQTETSDLADVFGKALNEAFKNYVPQPDQVAQAVRDAVKGVNESMAAQMEKTNKALLDQQKTLIETWQKSADQSVSDLKSLVEKLTSVSSSLPQNLQGGAERIEKVLNTQAQDLSKLVTEVTNKIEKEIGADTSKFSEAVSKQAEAFRSALGDYSSQLKSATDGLASQPGRIAEVQKDVEKVLHIQEAVEGTLKTVSATDQFMDTMGALKKHLEASDDLLREARKPRTIRLVEREHSGS